MLFLSCSVYNFKDCVHENDIAFNIRYCSMILILFSVFYTYTFFFVLLLLLNIITMLKFFEIWQKLIETKRMVKHIFLFMIPAPKKLYQVLLAMLMFVKIYIKKRLISSYYASIVFVSVALALALKNPFKKKSKTKANKKKSKWISLMFRETFLWSSRE